MRLILMKFTGNTRVQRLSFNCIIGQFLRLWSADSRSERK